MADDDGIDQVTEVTSTSWTSRLGESIGGVLFGVIAILISIALLFWNEGHAIKTAQGLSEGAGLVHDVASDRVDADNDNKLIHVTGDLTTGGPIVDRDFDVRSHGVRLVRSVEMYQWKEESQTENRSKLGGGEEHTTTYKYARAWSDKPIDSSKFKEPRGHTNPAMPYPSRDTFAAGTRIGAFTLNDLLLRGFGTTRPLAAGDAQATALQSHVSKPVTSVDGTLYVGRDSTQPATGDLRISFAEVPLQVASVVAVQSGSSLVPFRTHTGTNVELIAAGAVPAKAMFKEAEDENSSLTWILRGVGCLVMAIGFGLILRPLVIVADIVPLLGSIMGAGAFLVAMVCTVAVAPLVIGLAWLWYRPLIGIAVLVIGVGATWGLTHLARQRAVQKTATAS